MRPARPDDAAKLGEIHAAGLLRQLGVGTGRALSADVTGKFDPVEIAAGWRHSISEPPSPKHKVLVALDGSEVVGFAAISPLSAEESAGDAGAVAMGAPKVDAEIIALEVDLARPNDTYAARLLNACADTLALAGAASMRLWVVRGDEMRTRFLTESGFAPLGMRRVYEVSGAEVVEDAWWAEIGDPA